MAAVAVNNAFYSEYQGVDYLSKTFQSSLRFTPSDVKRQTISQENYRRHREKENRVPNTPWGRKFSYGSIGHLCLPPDHRPKDEPPRVQKGHRHYASGVCVHPRYVATDGKYAVTTLRRSNLRATDELIESPTRVDVSKHAIDLKFPAEHPFATHIERANVFPSCDIPPSIQNGSSPGEIPVAAPHLQILSKARGSAYRHEKSASPKEWERKPVEWIEGPNFYQLFKGGDNGKQRFYPTPVKSLDPNINVSRKISPETVTALKNLRKDQWTSTYQREMSPKQKYTPNHSMRDVQDNPDASSYNEHICEQDATKDERSGERSVHFADDHSGVTNAELYSGDGVHSERLSPLVSERLSPLVSERPPLIDESETTPRCSSRSYITASYPPDKYNYTDNSDNHDYSEELSRGWSRSDIRRKFNCTHRDSIPDLRRKPDLRITTNERRHRFPDVGDAGSYVWNGLAVPHLEGS